MFLVEDTKKGEQLVDTKKALIYDPSKFETLDMVQDMFSLSNTLKDIVNSKSKQIPEHKAHLLTSNYIDFFKEKIVNSINESIEEDNEDSLKYDGYVFTNPDPSQESFRNNFSEDCLRLGKAISLNITTKDGLPLTYEKAYNSICNAIGYEVKQLQIKTKCIKETLHHVIILLYGSAIHELYKIHYSTEFNNHNIRKNTNYSLLEVLTEKLSNTTDNGEYSVVLDEIEDIEKINNQLDKDFLNKWYDSKDLNKLCNRILEEIYPGERIVELDNSLPTIPHTRYPERYVTPKDKVTNRLFNGDLCEEMIPLSMENRGSNIELTAKVSIGFEDLENVKISNRNITPYDREVHDSIVSLYIDGNNEYMTPLMIYRTMTGNPEAKLTENIMNAISESITRLSITRVTIDTTKEVKAYKNMDKVLYQENLLYTKQVTAIHKGEVNEWIKIIEPPILYQYADSKNQVARVDIKLLNTPINKNEESIVLQGFLYRRINAMPEMRKNYANWDIVLYSTIYKHLKIDAISDVALRDKQRRVRDQAHRILDHWIKIGFIKGYTNEPKGRQRYYRLRITI